MYSLSHFVTAAFLLATAVQGHGVFSDPVARRPGDNYKAACGTAIYGVAKSGWDGSIEQYLRAADTGYKAESCNLYLCKGALLSDNMAGVQSWHAGDSVNLHINITVKHTGPANVSVVDTATNTAIGSPLIWWPDYSVPAADIPKNQTDFNVTIPADLGTKCSKAGACVLKWWWNATIVAGLTQTYEDCVDFTA